jgi:hypothetical protein
MSKVSAPARLAREQRYEEMRALHREGLKLDDIAERFEVHPNTVRRALKAAEVPEPITDDEEVVAELVALPTQFDVLDLGPADFTVTVAEAGLGELASIANKYHDGAVGAYLENAWHAGHALLAAKAQLGHGGFLPWLQVNFHGSRQMANDYMRIAAAGDSPANVVTSLHLDETAQPSINAATKVLAARTAASKSAGKKRDTVAKKQKTVRDSALKKVRAVADFVRKEAVKALGTMTRTDADEYASELKGYLEVLDEYYDKVNHIAKADAPAQIVPLHSDDEDES